jgi:hypothetical protein
VDRAGLVAKIRRSTHKVLQISDRMGEIGKLCMVKIEEISQKPKESGTSAVRKGRT